MGRRLLQILLKALHTHVKHAYFGYTQMSIHVHMRVYTRLYVSLLCMPPVSLGEALLDKQRAFVE